MRISNYFPSRNLRIRRSHSTARCKSRDFKTFPILARKYSRNSFFPPNRIFSSSKQPLVLIQARIFDTFLRQLTIGWVDVDANPLPLFHFGGNCRRPTTDEGVQHDPLICRRNTALHQFHWKRRRVGVVSLPIELPDISDCICPFRQAEICFGDQVNNFISRQEVMTKERQPY